MSVSAHPQSVSDAEQRQWYQEPLVWLVIAIPGSAVIAGIATIVLAHVFTHSMVVDDYYSYGKELNRVLGRDKKAAEMQLEATVSLDRTTRAVRIDIHLPTGADADSLGSTPIELKWMHATNERLDRIMLVENRAGVLTVSTPFELHSGVWYVQLGNTKWRVRKRIVVSEESLRAPISIRLRSEAPPA